MGSAADPVVRKDAGAAWMRHMRDGDWEAAWRVSDAACRRTWAAPWAVPVWTLLHANPDWRWMRHRDDSPWYPTMRLFRQERPGDWETVIARVAAELGRLREK